MPQVNFEFGKKKTSAVDYAVIGIVLEIIIETLAKVLRCDRSRVIALIDEFQRNHWPSWKWLEKFITRDQLNDYIIGTSEFLDNRVERDVDSAIIDYENEVGTQEDIEIGSGTFFEEAPDGSEAQSLLGGEMGITADWRHNKGI